MEIEEGRLFGQVVVGELVAVERSFKLAPFFLLVARFGEPGPRHVLEKFQGVLSIFGKEDERLAALFLEEEPLF